MTSEIKITNSKKGVAVVEIEGTIGVPEEWQFEEPAGRIATYNKFQQSLAAIERIKECEVVVNIRSTGGDVGDALLIYDALRGLEGARITTRCFGYVASAATIIAQAASDGGREISASALYLVHNSVAGCEGNAKDLRQSQELLEKTDRRIAEIYAARSGREAGEFASLMAENNGSGRWLSPEETLAAGLADRIIEGKGFAGGTKKRRLPADSVSEGVLDAEVIRRQQNIELERLKRRITSLESENALMRARPTELIKKEDPSTVESRLSANGNAYEKDAENFFRTLL